MDAERWGRVTDLFDRALAVPEAEREAFLKAECPDDCGLSEQVLALLREDARGDWSLEEHVASWARAVLEPTPGPAFQIIGRYRVLRILGQGGMGVVYLAEDALGRHVAIKMLTDASLSPGRRERFEREQHLLAQLTHPSIARIYEANMLADGTPYFVMEYVEGLRISEYCATNAHATAQRVGLFRQVCEAVQYAHREAVIHRDLKPSNILVSAEGKVSLLDFGIARQIDSLDRPAPLTQTGQHMMTLAYAAPEQLRGTAVGVYTDVYALGVVFYELLTDTRCFDLTDCSPTQVIDMILNGTPPQPSVRARLNAAARPHATAAEWADLDLICFTAMHKDAQRRYSSVEALIRDLDHYRNIEPLEASPDRLGYRVGKFIRRNRGPVAGTAVALTSLLVMATFYTVRLTQQRTLAQEEAAKAKEVSEYAIGLFDAADPLGEHAADELEVRTLLERGVQRAENLSAQPQVQAQMQNVLGRVYTRLSKYEEAESLLQQALVIRRRETKHPLDLAETLANLGVLHRYDSQYDSAEKFTREALAIRERVLPASHPDIAVTLDNLGVILSSQGKHEDASVALTRALQILRENYAQPHPMMDHTLNNLAVNEFNQGHYDEAERHYREALEVAKVTYGPEHAYTAVDLANLGVLLETTGRFAEADAVLTEALRITQRRLGENHYETAFRMTQLGGMLRRKGDLDRAEAYLRKSTEIEKRVLEPNHRNHAVTLNHLALTLQAQQQYAEAEPLLRESVEVFRQRLGPKHEFTGTVMCSLGFLLHLQGKKAEAEQLLREGVQTLAATLPPGHDMIALNESRYGVLLTALGRYDEAERLLLHSYDLLSKTFGNDHKDTIETAGRLAALYAAWGKPAQAAAFGQKDSTTRR